MREGSLNVDSSPLCLLLKIYTQSFLEAMTKMWLFLDQRELRQRTSDEAEILGSFPEGLSKDDDTNPREM